jgi:aminobenzoyl-glutamate utilization protein A
MATGIQSNIIQLRRDLHEHPEIGWCELYTTARIVEEVRDIDIDELRIGPEFLTEERFRPPDPADLKRARKRARETEVDETLLADIDDGYTGAMAVIQRGTGPTIGLRVDIDALPQEESDDPDHHPATEGFRSQYDNRMHACGHDAHAAIGVGVLDQIAESDFDGTLKVFFQPAEELGAGAASIVGSGHLRDIDTLLAVHVGLDEDTGTVVPGIDSFLALNGFTAEFGGSPAHAGNSPQDGANALQAMATAISNLHGITRHADGDTRINVGKAEGGSARNIVPESALLEGEVRGETTRLREYMESQVETVLQGAADLHECDLGVNFADGLPSAECDSTVADCVGTAAQDHGGTVIHDSEDVLGGSEDATRLMRAVQANGGQATYVGVGASNPSGHHTARFDVDEDAIPFAVDMLVDSILSIVPGDETEHSSALDGESR